METLVQGCYIGHEAITYKGSQPRRWSSLSPALIWTVSARGGDPSSYIWTGGIFLLICIKTLFMPAKIFFFFFFCFFLGLHLQHMEVPRLQVKGQIGAATASLYHNHRNARIWTMFAAYTIAQGNAILLTHRARPGIEPTSSWILVGSVTCCATTGTPETTF